jgi:hypothetical protein
LRLELIIEKKRIIYMFIKYFLQLESRKLIIFSSLFCVMGTVLFCLLSLKYFRVPDPENLIITAIVGSMISPMPAAWGYCFLRGHLNKKEKELKKVNEDLVKALKSVKELGALLPMCISCKKIRSDKGYWDRMENYVMEHSKASFSHGICPDCLQEFMAKSKNEMEQEDGC